MAKLTDIEGSSPTVLVRVFPAPKPWAEKGAEALLTRISGLMNKKNFVSVGLSGGNTPIPFYRAAAKKISSWPEDRKERILWFFSDERCVPPDHEQSNYRMVHENLFSPGKISEATVFRIHGENSHHDREALRYEKVLSDTLGAFLPHPPSLDILLLGVGPDGHTASLFPGTSPEDDRHRLVVAVPPSPDRVARISLSYRSLGEAGTRIFLVTGREKNAILGDVLNPEGLLPTQWVIREAEMKDHPSEFWIDQEACPAGATQWADIRRD